MPKKPLPDLQPAIDLVRELYGEPEAKQSYPGRTRWIVEGVVIVACSRPLQKPRLGFDTEYIAAIEVEGVYSTTESATLVPTRIVKMTQKNPRKSLRDAVDKAIAAKQEAKRTRKARREKDARLLALAQRLGEALARGEIQAKPQLSRHGVDLLLGESDVERLIVLIS